MLAPSLADSAAAGLTPAQGRRQNALQKVEAKGTIDQGQLAAGIK